MLCPGVDPAAPLVQNFLRKRIEMIGELEFSWELCKCPVVAITGTNGKTTTTELVARMLNACGITHARGREHRAGLRGRGEKERRAGCDDAGGELVPTGGDPQLPPAHRRVAEFYAGSSGPLPDMEAYRAAKLRIFENQTEEDFAVVNLRETLPPLAAKKITFSAHATGGDFELRDGVIFFHGEPVLRMADTKLRGAHNAENLMAAMGVGLARGLSFAQMAPPLSAIEPLPHRCELVRTLDGVDYVNDSKATILDALEDALVSRDAAGGPDRGREGQGLRVRSRDCAGRAEVQARDADRRDERADRGELWEPRVPCEKAELTPRRRAARASRRGSR